MELPDLMDVALDPALPFPPVASEPRQGRAIRFVGDMGMGTNLLEPEPRRKPRGEETTRVFCRPSLPDAHEPRQVPAPKRVMELPYLLAPAPWPRGQFRALPED